MASCSDLTAELASVLGAPTASMGSYVVVLDDPTSGPLVSTQGGSLLLHTGERCAAVVIVWKGRRDVSVMMPVRSYGRAYCCLQACRGAQLLVVLPGAQQ